MSSIKDKKAILRDTTYYTSSTYIAQAVGMITAIVVRRGLGPMLMGVWELIKVITRYSEYFNLGISTVAVRDIPFHRAKNDEAQATQIKEVCFTYTILVAFLAAAALITWSIVGQSRLSNEFIIGLRAAAAIVVFTSIYSFFVNMMRAYKNFIILSRLMVINAILMLILALVLLPRFRLYGMLATVILTLSLCCGYAFFITGYRLRLHFDRVRLFYVLKTGVPIFLSGLGLMLLMSVDKIIIARLLGFEQLGFYTIASMIIMLLYTLPKSFGIVIFPRMQEDYARGGSAGRIESYLTKPTVLIGSVMPIVIAFAYLAVPVLVHYLLPRYLPGITAFKILMGGMFFLCAAYPSNIFMVTVNKQAHLAAILFGVVVAAALTSCLFLRKGLGLEGVAFAMSLSYAVYFWAITYYCLKKILHYRRTTGIFAAALGPFAYFFLIVFIIDRAVSITHPVGALAAKAALLLLGTTAFFAYLFKRHSPVIDELKRLLHRRPAQTPPAYEPEADSSIDV